MFMCKFSHNLYYVSQTEIFLVLLLFIYLFNLLNLFFLALVISANVLEYNVSFDLNGPFKLLCIHFNIF